MTKKLIIRCGMASTVDVGSLNLSERSEQGVYF
jgi:hypothetical protein